VLKLTYSNVEIQKLSRRRNPQISTSIAGRVARPGADVGGQMEWGMMERVEGRVKMG